MKERPMTLIFIGCLAGVTVAREDISFVTVLFLLIVVTILFLSRKKPKIFLLIMPCLLGALFYQGKEIAVDRIIKRIDQSNQSYEEGYVTRRIDKEKSIALYINASRDKGNMLVYYGGEEDIYPGDTIRFMGRPEVMKTATNPGEFSQKNYYFSQGIYHQLFTNQIQILHRNPKGLSYGLYQVQQFIHNQLQKQYNKNQSAFLQGMFLGDKSLLEDTVKDDFRNSGMSHLLAVSGLHISLFGGSVYKLLRCLGIKFGISSCMGISFAVFYGILTGASISSIRAIFMLGIYFLSQILGEAYDLLSSLSFVGFCVLIYNPFAVLNSGFWFSFGAMFIIGIYGQKKKLKSKVLESFRFAFVIAIGMFPLIVYVQYEAPIASFLANVVGVPVASYAFMAATITIALPFGLWHELIGEYLNVIFWLSRQSYGLITIGKVSIVWVVLWYLGMYIFMQQKWKLFNIPKIAITYACILIGTVLTMTPNQQLAFLDVGQGDCIAIGGRNGMILVDGGSTSKKNTEKYQILPYLRYMGCSKIKVAIVTHTDADHYNGILELIKLKKISYLGLPLIEKDEAYDTLEKTAKNNGTKVFYLSKGKRILANDVELKIIHPSANSRLEKNAASIVMQGSIYKQKILLTGDIEKDGETELLGEDLNQINILKVAHHGSKNSTPIELLDVAKPRYAIISCGINNMYGHPHQELIERLHQYNSVIYRTDNNGAIIWNKRQFVCYNKNQR